MPRVTGGACGRLVGTCRVDRHRPTGATGQPQADMPRLGAVDGRGNALLDDSCSDPDPTLPEWFLMRRIRPGQAGFDEAAASVLPDDARVAAVLTRENAQAFVLSDPAADPASRPAAVALVQPLGDTVAEIRLGAGRPGALLARLLAPAMDALRAQGVRRAVSSSEGIGEDVASALELIGFRNQGEYFALEL